MQAIKNPRLHAGSGSETLKITKSVAPRQAEEQDKPKEVGDAVPGIPDAKFIRDRIPIQEVARMLGLWVNGRQGRCWRIEAHRNGDSNPSIWFDRKNRGRCQVCDSQAWSNIDLVKMIQQISAASAIRWIAQRFKVPLLPKGKHLSEQRRWSPRCRVGTGDIMENFVRSGLLATLTGAEAKVLEVLKTFADIEGRAVISYRGIMRYAGIASAATVRAALLQLQKLHLLEIVRTVNGGFRACSAYQFTPDDPAFLAIARECHDHHLDLIQAQRDERAAARSVLPRSILSSITEVRGKFTLHPTEASNLGRKARFP